MLTKINSLFSEPKCRAAIVILLLLLPMALGMGSVIYHEFWYGINEILINSDVQDGVRHGIGLLGVLHATMEAAIWGTVFGGGAGAIAGIVAGL